MGKESRATTAPAWRKLANFVTKSGSAENILKIFKSDIFNRKMVFFFLTSVSSFIVVIIFIFLLLFLFCKF